MTLSQEVDSIIAEENINDSVPAITPDEPQEPDTPAEQPTDQPVDGDPADPGDKPADGESTDPEAPKDPEAPEAPKEEPKVEERSPTETITEAKTLIENLQLSEDKVFNQDGSVRPWTEVVPAGAYLASQLEPVVVTDKEGKQHEFMLISDVEKAFPEGFEAKNNLEQMKFEKQIMANESKFDDAVKTYKQAESRYNEETGGIVQARQEQKRIGDEYRAMADQGLVPKIVGDASDPKFAESAAVKELNNLMTWMDKKNTENAAKGLGQISSLYVAKQLMDSENGQVQKVDKAKQIIQERQEVASLSSSPTPDQGNKQKVQDIPMSRLADAIIAEEGLR